MTESSKLQATEGRRNKRAGPNQLGATVKFKCYDTAPDPLASYKKTPSQHLDELAKPVTHVNGWRPKPRIVELLNLTEFSHHVNSVLPVDEPLFQPFPPEIVFHSYQPFKPKQAVLYLRNNDTVPRRVKVVPPSSQYFSVQRVQSGGKEEGTKVASGMEVAYTITFRPDSLAAMACDLVICTEREKFVVPVLATGTSLALDLPDLVQFSAAPCKLSTRQTLLVRNVGNSAAGFQMHAQAPFSVRPAEAFLEPGENLQVQLDFLPLAAGTFHSELEVWYADKQQSVFTQLVGSAQDLPVGLSQDTVLLLPTYVTKMSQRTFRVVNNSEHVITYAVKAHASLAAEQAAVSEQLQQLEASLGAGHAAGVEGVGSGSDSESEDAILAQPQAAADRQLLARCQAVSLDSNLFSHANFCCLPAQGSVPPRSETEVVVQFMPDYARDYEVTTYLELQGREQRLPLVLKAKGLGPAAVFSYDVLDVGDTFANTLHQYEVELQNRGKIDVHFQLVPPMTPFGVKFSFEPAQGLLLGGEIQLIKVKLLSDLLGVFDETFQWAIRGSSTPLALQLKGRVRGPTPEVDTELLDFGIVSYGFRYTKDFTLHNTSEIPMRFAWRVPEDAGDPLEFQILPSRGTILPHGSQKICVEFVSRTVQRYTAHNLVLDIPGVAKEQLAIALRGECAVPRITLDCNPLEFGSCFVRHPYKRSLTLSNQSKLPAKFEVLPQDLGSKGLAAFTAEPSSGGIPALGEQRVEVQLCTQTLGRVQLPLHVRVVGSRGRPLEVTIDARSLGPELLLGPDQAPVQALIAKLALAWGNASVLVQHQRKLQIYNPCLIPADFKLFIEGSDSAFSVEPREAHLEPGCSMTATVTVCMDDTRAFTDNLHLLVSEGADISIPLDATGTGNTLVAADIEHDQLDFKHQFLGRAFQRRILVSNLGCKTQSLVWTNTEMDRVRLQYAKIARSAGKKFSMDLVPLEVQPVFSITPEKASLPAKESVAFLINGFSHRVGDISEQFVCMASVGGNSKQERTAFNFAAKVLVVTPLLETSEQVLVFKHTYQPGQPISVLVKPLGLRNLSKLPLDFSLKLMPPFHVDRPAVQLAPLTIATVNVSFDPNFKNDLQSGIVKQKLQVVYSDNPQRDSVDLHGIMEYPNLALSATTVEFGSCLSDTTRRIPLTIVNTSQVDVVYSWAWDKDSLREDTNSIASMNMKAARQPRPPAVNLFDIMPINGVLKAGASETITFAFFAYPGVKASATAMCLVEGGPTYQVAMSGESNNIKYAVEPQFVDMGQQLFNKTVEREVVISNQGKVPFDYAINMRLLSRPSIASASPSSGVVGPGHREVVKLRVCPGIPDRLLETVLVELAHFDPIPVQVVVEGVYPAVLLNLPRIKDPLFLECQATAKQAKPDPSLTTAQGSVVLTAASLRTHAPQPSRGGSANADTRSVAGMSVARSMVSTKAGAGALTSKLSAKLADGVPPERKAELEAERLRLVRMLAGQELAQLKAAEEALLAAELDAARATLASQGSVQPQSSATLDSEVESSGTQPEGAAGTGEPAVVDLTAPAAVPPGGLSQPAPTRAVSPLLGRKHRPIQPPLPSLVAAHYVLDFGCIIKGSSRSRRFKLVNPSSQVVSFKFDRAVLESWGLKAEPEGVSKLPGAPDNGSVEVVLTLQANKQQVVLGPMELVLPLPIKGAPGVLITIKANVQVPDLQASQDTLDFGDVQTGQAKVITVQLHNHKLVPCEWAVKKPVETAKAKDWSFFRCEPSSGQLEPGQRLNMQVVFTPVLGRDTPYSQALPIKVTSNPRSLELSCSARGVTPRIEFQPPALKCGPILPATPSQAPAETRVMMVNPCPFPVEVVALDFDSRYLGDEDILRGLEDAKFGEQGQLFMSPLPPGAPLWPELVAEVEQRRAMDAAAVAATAEAAGGATASPAIPAVSQGSEATPSGPPPATAVEATQEVGSLVPLHPAPAFGSPAAEAGSQSGLEAVTTSKQVYVLYGAEQGLVHEQAGMLGERYDLPVTSLDDLLFEGADLEAPPLPEGALPPPPSTPPPATPSPAPVGKKGKAEAPPPPVQPTPAEVLDPNAPPTFDRGISDLLYATVFTDPDLEGQPGFVPPHTKLPAAELESAVLRGLRQALDLCPQFSQGLVLQGLQSRYVDPATGLRLFLQALRLQPQYAPEPEPDPKVKPKPKVKGMPETPPPVRVPETWLGPHRVYITCLGSSKERALGSLRERKKAAELPALPAASASAGAEGPGSSAEQQEGQAGVRATTPPAASQGTSPPLADSGASGAAPALLPSEGEGGEAAAEAVRQAEAAQLAAAEASLQAEAEAAVEVFAQQHRLVCAVMGQAPGSELPEGRGVVAANQVALLETTAEVGMSREQLQLAVCGITFKLGRRASRWPAVPADEDLIPEPYAMQIVTKPRPRPPRPPISRFKLYTVSPLPLAPPTPTPTLEEGRPESAGSASKAASKTPPRTPPTKPAKPVPKGKAKVEEEVEAPPPLNPQYTGASRWVVPAQGAVELVVLFQSPEVGTFTETLGFQVLGGERLVSVPCTGACDYPHISTDYRTVYYRKVKARPPSPSVSRQFIVSKGLFEFGPLLMGKDITGYDTGAHPANTAKFRITNNGLFDLTAEFQLQSQIAAREAAEDSKGKKGAKPTSAKPDAKGKGKAGPEQESVFMVAPLSLALKVDETQDVTVYAFPMEEGIVEDALVCTIKDNPEPVTFPLSVVGAKPVVHVRLDDGTPAPPHITAVPVPVAVELKPKTPPGKPGKAAAEQGPVNKILTEGVVFERLLLGRKDSKTFIITNPGLLPIKWRLTGVEGLPKELVVSPVSGELEARSEAVVSVELSAIEKRDVTGKVVLEVLDQAELLGVAASIPIAIKGEAYRIERDLKFPQEGLAGLDYGLVRVVDTKSLPLALKNTGKYPISYALTLRSALARELFTLQPEQGTVEPNKEATIQVVFNKAKELQRELSISSAPDITLAIIEPLTSNKEDIVPIRVSVRAVFSKYAITPARGVNFGPQAYNTTSKPRTFELVNTGEFPFNFRLFNFATPTTPVSVADKKVGKAATPPKKAAPQSQLVFGQFVAEPCEGVVAPGAKAEVSLVFKAEGARTYSEVLGIDVSERDVADSPGGISYEVGGESCIPGIDTSSLESIFEEHTISNCLDPTGAVPCQLGLRERAFNFGPVTADLTVPSIVSHPPSASSVQGKKAAAPEPSSLDLTSPGGIKAALKFTNPIKIPCVVNFSIKPRAPAPDPKNPVMFPMVVQPAQLVIPPHESRFTTVHFRPHAIAQYSGLLEAVVEQGSDPQTKSFTCEIRGEGSLPSLSLQEPSVFDSHGRPLLKFPRVLLGLSAKLQVLLRNNGLLPASARMEAEHHSAFTITGGPEGLFTVQPGRSVAFGVTFSPQQLGVLSHEMRVKVNQNQYEDYRIAMSGEGYQEDVTFDHLPDGQLDELRLADCPVGTARQVVFCLHNHAAKHFKFRWPTNIPGLTFSPATGHLHAGASKDISLTFQAQAPVKLSPQPVKLALVAIDYLPTAPGLPPQPVNWDDRGVLATFSSTSSPTSASKPQQPAMQPEPEPSVKELAGSSKELVLKVYAVADNARYECSAPQSGIQFRPTMMFQTRAFAFTLTNTSTARLDFKFTVMTADGSQVDTTGLYSVTPEGGAIAAGGTASISVAFSPQEVDSCHRLLVCDIPGLDPGSTPLTRALTGKVLRPWCHFELVDSEYVSAGLRDPGLPGPSGEVEPLDPNTKVLEIESLGVRVRNTKRFMVLNPTAVGYNFAWEPHGEASSSSASPFRCVTTKGVIGPGRRFEMVFEFTPQADQLAEAFWTFRIPDQSITLPFLLVGHVSEPRITLDKPAISFGQCLVGGARGRGTVSLVNSESMPFSFTLDKSTYDATEQQQQLLGRKPVVEFTPFQGVIPAQSSLTLQALFAPQEERSYNYNVVCKVANKPTRLTLNVKGEGYALHDALVLEGAEGLSTPLAANAVNPLDFGQVIVNERSVRSLALVNTGSLAYDFVWDLGSNPRLSVKPITGTVGKGERVPVELAYHPHGPDKLRDYTVTCQIVNGGRYTLLLSGKGHKPRLDLSFLSHDFGARPLWQPGMSSASQTLRLTNRDTQPVAVDPQPLDTSGTPGSVWVVELPGCVLQSGASADGTISFRPEAEQHYTARLPLEINGLYTVAVELKGEGTPVRIEPVNPAHRAVNMGAVLKGQSSSRTVSLINRGRAAVHVHLGPSSSWLAQRSMQALPASPILLRPRETADVSLYYRPTERVRPWSESMTLDVDGAPLTVFTVSGSCHGTELTLASDVLPFGPVVLGSSASKRLALENTGDVGTKYSWDNKGLGPHFTIAPEEGFLAPGQTVRLDVTFRPQAVSPDIRVERVRCTVEGGSNLALTLTGACVTTVPQAEPVNFACAVRSSITQTVNLSNPSSSPWQLRPVLSNDFFSGPEYVDVPAYSKAAYVITYRPLTMSSPDQPHEGSVFFPIPDGTGLLHRLVGRAEAPVPEGRIEKSITAKQHHTELLRVSNWLSRQQRFKVTIQRKAVDKATVLEGPEYIDVPAHSSKDYKLSVYSYTASVSQAVVTFKNESSGEYTFYELKLSASPAARQGELVLECPVRSSTAARVSVRNPLDSAVTLRGSTTSKLASVAASTVLAPNATSQVPVTFRPLLVGEQEAVLKLESTELGVYEWGLRLKGVPTIPEKVITFNVPLGGRETQVFKFRHLLDDKADYKISMASGTKSVFEAPALVSAQPAAADGSGYECSVEVVFEPNAVSDTFRDTLVVSSPVGGVFECPLLGRCMAPKPQGPVDCSKGSATVPFKNVFATDAEFMYSVDNQAFVVKPSEKLGAKKATNIQVTFKPDPKQPGLPVRTAKLTVTCSSQTSVAWVFYLQA